MSNQSALQRALAIRLNLQISLSSLPVVEEWMDIHLTRWLEHVPLPPEMPSGHVSSFLVKLGTDLQRLTWSAYGNPTGFIPKLAKYFEAIGMDKADMALLDQLGNGLEPELIGSWIRVTPGAIANGWQFCDPHPFAELATAFGDHEAKAQLVRWVDDHGIETFQRFSQAIGEEAFSEVELPVPGVAVDDQVETASRAFETFSGAPLAEPVREALATALEPRIALAVRIRAGQIVRVAALAPAVAGDVVERLCKQTGIRFESTVRRLQGALRADGSERIEYARAGQTELLDIHIVPTDQDPRARSEPAN